MKAYIGIDPGAKGFLTICNENGYEFIPIADNSPLELGHALRRIKQENPEIMAAMEQIHAVFGSSAKSTFSFGEIFGLLQGLLIANDIPYTLVPPKTWQGEIWIHPDKVDRYKTDGKKMVDPKGTSINAARRLFPTIDLHRTPSCKKPDDNKVDSLLICEYARRKNL